MPRGKAPLATVAARRAMITEAIRQGKPNKIIAWELGMSERNVKNDIHKILKTAGVGNRTAIAVHSLAAQIERLRAVLLATHQSIIIGDPAEIIINRIDAALIPELEDSP